METPYKAEQRNGYWIALDTRTGKGVSYPAANKRKCEVEVGILNRAYVEAVTEMSYSDRELRSIVATFSSGGCYGDLRRRAMVELSNRGVDYDDCISPEELEILSGPPVAMGRAITRGLGGR